MAVNQQTLSEIRYMKRTNLEEESKIVGNYMRDIIRQYGVDVNYYKIKIPYMDVFSTILSENSKVLHAYGEYVNPSYQVSARMISFMEIENDVFNFNKFGVLPNMDVNFYFDTGDFACSLAPKLGQLREYPIKEQKFTVEVPEIVSDYVLYDYDGDGTVSSEEKTFLSDSTFPYVIGGKIPSFYESEILSGRFHAVIGPYHFLSGELSNETQEYTVLCHPYEHGDAEVNFPANDSIYKSFNHTIAAEEFVDQMLFLTYKVRRIKTSSETKFVLHGTLHGSVLFHDVAKVGKYMDMIHPDVGDIVTIDFPDETNRQQYEITDCYDKNLGNDGINPLLHRYVWKCKARRYISSGEDFPEVNEGNERWKEKIDFLDNSEEVISKRVSEYDLSANDGVYGGYERNPSVYDKNAIDPSDVSNLEFINNGDFITIFTFHDKSKLVTDGYELFFVDTRNMMYMLTTTEDFGGFPVNLVKSDLQYIKSTEDALFFVNFEGKVQMLCHDEEITQGEVQMCLNSLIDATVDTKSTNKEGDHYYKFKNSNTVLMSLGDSLYCRFGNPSHKVVKLTVSVPNK